jgi:hypothetical protein
VPPRNDTLAWRWDLRISLTEGFLEVFLQIASSCLLAMTRGLAEGFENWLDGRSLRNDFKVTPQYFFINHSLSTHYTL